MSDLREALSHIDAGHITLTSTAHLWALNEIYAAARRFLALTETGPDYEAAARALSAGIFQGEIDEVPEVQRKLARLAVDAALADYLTDPTPTP